MEKSTDKITIRRVTENEAAVLREIRLEALRVDPLGFSADYERDEKRPLVEWGARIRENPIFMAWEGETPAGMTGFYRSPSSKTRHHGSIWGVYVRPAYRNHGLCGRLINACLEWARDNGLRMAYIATAATNTAAIRCYTRCGFSVYGLQPMAVYVNGVYYDELHMAQALR